MEMDVVLLLYQLWSSWCSFRVSFSIASRCELCCEAYCANASSFSSSSSSSASLECVLKAAEAANGLVTISCTKVAMLQSCVPFLDPRRLYRFQGPYLRAVLSKFTKIEIQRNDPVYQRSTLQIP